MNEIQFLRSQIAGEQNRLETVCRACATVVGTPTHQQAEEAFIQACAEYLIHSLKLLEARDRARLALQYERNAKLDQKLGDGTVLGTQLTALDAALTAHREQNASSTTTEPLALALHKTLQLVHNYQAQRTNVAEGLDDRRYSVEDWRRTAFVDAGSILAERSRYARIQATLPSGIRLTLNG